MNCRSLSTVAVFLGLICLWGCGAGQNTSSPDPGGQQKHPGKGFQHIIVLVQENRSYDQYMGRFGAYRRQFHDDNTPVSELDLITPVRTRTGAMIHPFHFRTVCVMNPIARPYDPEDMVYVGYYDWTDLNYYYELFYQYATSDQFYAAVPGETEMNRMMLMGATTGGYQHVPSVQGGWTQPTIFDRLSDAGVSWKYYVQDSNPPFIAGYATAHKHPENIVKIDEYFQDLQSPETMPQVMFIERWSGLDEHPGMRNNIQSGAHRAATLIDAFLKSPAYATSAFVLTYDEFGGFWDSEHPIPTVPPADLPPGSAPDLTKSGRRIPFVVVSPFAKAHYVSHTKRDATAVLKFIEDRFNLQPLTARDAAAEDITDMFDFNDPPVATPPPLPTQVTNGVCDVTLQSDPNQ